MSPQRQGTGPWRIYVPTASGGRRLRSTGTRDKRTAAAMERMVTDLGGRGQRAFDLLEAVLATPARLTLPELFDAYRDNQLAALRRRLDDVVLSDYLDRWQQWLTGRVAPETQERYRVHLATLHGGKAWHRSSLTPAAVEQWLSGLAGTSGTKRKYYAALASFLGYLDTIGLDHGDPLRRLQPPKASLPRVVYLDLPDVQRVIDRADEPYRTLYTLLYGTGIDLSTALALTRRHLLMDAKEIHAPGTKSVHRNRVCVVAEWAWPAVAAWGADLLPEARLFPGVNRYTASDIHRRILADLGIRGEGRDAIRLHDARHFWAVRAIRAGTPIEIVARQLGHKDGTLALRVYGRFAPTSEERRHWEREATRKERGA